MSDEPHANSPSASSVALAKGAAQLRRLGLYPYYRRIDASVGTRVEVDGQERINLASNNYLGLANHPRLKESAVEAIGRYGLGCTGSRLLNGNFAVHEELEERLARFLGAEAAVVFSSGHQVNMGVIPTLCAAGDRIHFDAWSHGSIVESAARGEAARIPYESGDLSQLEANLAARPDDGSTTLIVVEGVLALDGRIADLPEILRLARAHGASVYLDDSHGFGVHGRQGRGTAEYFELADGPELSMTTLSKAFASNGGVVAGSRQRIEQIRHTARSLMYSVAMTPTAAATALACLDIVEEPGAFAKFRQRLAVTVERMMTGLRALGLSVVSYGTPVISIEVGGDLRALQVASALFERGVFVLPVTSPWVPAGHARLRTSYMATHSDEDLERCLRAFSEVAGEWRLRKTTTNNG